MKRRRFMLSVLCCGMMLSLPALGFTASKFKSLYDFLRWKKNILKELQDPSRSPNGLAASIYSQTFPDVHGQSIFEIALVEGFPPFQKIQNAPPEVYDKLYEEYRIWAKEYIHLIRILINRGAHVNAYGVLDSSEIGTCSISGKPDTSLSTSIKLPVWIKPFASTHLASDRLLQLTPEEERIELPRRKSLIYEDEALIRELAMLFSDSIIKIDYTAPTHLNLDQSVYQVDYRWDWNDPLTYYQVLEVPSVDAWAEWFSRRYLNWEAESIQDAAGNAIWVEETRFLFGMFYRTADAAFTNAKNMVEGGFQAYCDDIVIQWDKRCGRLHSLHHDQRKKLDFILARRRRLETFIRELKAALGVDRPFQTNAWGYPIHSTIRTEGNPDPVFKSRPSDR